MPCTISKSCGIKLSICITTLNRAAFIGETLENILDQATNDCEIVVLDAASTDDTERVVSQHARRCNRLRYVRQEMNNGWDRDIDRAVELAGGEYCWLMPDDDLLKPAAVVTVLEALRRDLSLIIVNTEVRDFNMSQVVQYRCLDFDSDRVYGSKELDRLVAEMGGMMTYCGGFIIKRSIWIAREKQRFYGSSFIHVGVIFQERLPGEALLIAEPLISYRMGNAHTWSPKMFDTFMIKWPSLVWSLTLSDSAKSKVCSAEPWRNWQQLLRWRGRGYYSLTEYRQSIRPHLHLTRERFAAAFIALLPGVLVNILCLIYFSVVDRQRRGVSLQFMRESRYYFRNWRIFERDS